MSAMNEALFGATHLLLIGLGMPLAILLIAGLCLAILQSATQVQEQLLTFFPKILCGFFLIYFGGGYFFTLLSDYLSEMIFMVSQVR